MLGTIRRFERTKFYGFIISEYGDELFFHKDNCFLPSGHTHFFRPGVAVKFDKGPGDTQAVNVELVEEPTVAIREISQVTFWDGKKKFGIAARRDCGCSIFFHERQIVTEGSKIIGIGTVLEHAVGLSRSGELCATDIEVIPSEDKHEHTNTETSA
jgi:cold shock CspA family protein